MPKLPKYAYWIALFFCWPTLVFAAPMLAAEAEGARIVLYDEPCQLKEVINLPYRAVWTEKGKDFEGCFGARPDQGIVMGYFVDKTVVAIPIQMFKRVQGA